MVNLRVVLVYITNIFLTIAIVAVNKKLFTEYQVPVSSLTFLHFVVTAIGVWTFEKYGKFKPKTIPFCQVLLLAVLYCSTIVANNKAVDLNTVGFNQISKSMSTPVILAMQMSMFGYRVTDRVMYTLVSGIFHDAFSLL